MDTTMLLTRRNLLTSAAVAGAGCTAAALAAPADSAVASTDENTDTDWLGTEPAIEPQDCTETIETDVLVIGGAVAGSLAAYGAIQGGASRVCVLERNAIFHYGGSQASFLNSKFQLSNGQPKIEPEEVVYGIMQNTANRADIALWRVWAERSGEVCDSLIENVLQPKGVPFACSMHPDESETPLNRVHDINVLFGNPEKDNYKEFLTAVHEWLSENGADIRYSTRAEKLVKDETGRVIGAIATNASGETQFFKASQGVIVATGGYASNAAMMKAFIPEKVRNLCSGLMYTMYMEPQDLPEEPLDDGLGHRMLCWAGAEMEGDPHGFLGWSNGGHIGMPYLQVDQAGHRFMNEALFPVNEVQQIVEQYMPNGYYTWEIVTEEDRVMPCFIGIDPNVLNEIAATGGAYLESDTIEGLAEQMEVDPAELKATVERYNANCEAGVDADYMKEPRFLIPVATPPYRAFKMYWVFTTTLGGVRVNPDFQVLDAERKPIPGLYAAGNTVGRRFGYAYDSSGMGMSNSQAMVAGYVAGEKAASERA